MTHCGGGRGCGLTKRARRPAQAHSEKSKQDLTAYEQFKTPQVVTVTTLTPNRKEIGKAFKKDAKVPSPHTKHAHLLACNGAHFLYTMTFLALKQSSSLLTSMPSVANGTGRSMARHGSRVCRTNRSSNQVNDESSVVHQAVETALAALSEDDLKCYQADLERDGQFKLGEHLVTSAMVDIKPEQKKLSGRCNAASVLLMHACALIGIALCSWCAPVQRWRRAMHSLPSAIACCVCQAKPADGTNRHLMRHMRVHRNFTPSVIEPSFGIGRILYCMFEHTFYARPDDAQVCKHDQDGGARS